MLTQSLTTVEVVALWAGVSTGVIGTGLSILSLVLQHRRATPRLRIRVFLDEKKSGGEMYYSLVAAIDNVGRVPVPLSGRHGFLHGRKEIKRGGLWSSVQGASELAPGHSIHLATERPEAKRKILDGTIDGVFVYSKVGTRYESSRRKMNRIRKTLKRYHEEHGVV